MKPIQDAIQSTQAAVTTSAHTIQVLYWRERVFTIFKEEYDHMCGLAIKHLRTVEMFAKDIVADTLMEAIEKWPVEKFEGLDDLKAYLCKCVINRSRNFAKRQSRLIHIQDVSLDSFLIVNPMAKLDLDRELDRDLNLNLDTLIAQLPDKQRAVFSRFSKGESHKKIAAELGITEGASKTNVYNAKKKLQAIIRALIDEDPNEPRPSGGGTRTQKKGRRKTSPQLSISTAHKPKLKDLLDYLLGKEQHANTIYAIRLWIIIDSFAVDIIEGLQYTLMHHSKNEVISRFKKGKDELRERMTKALHAPCDMDKKLLFQPNKITLPVRPLEEDNSVWRSFNSNTSIKFNPAIHRMNILFEFNNPDTIDTTKNQTTQCDTNQMAFYYLRLKGLLSFTLKPTEQ
jgi:RNA polymerase sigma-70 factor (ECF subfamily)